MVKATAKPKKEEVKVDPVNKDDPDFYTEENKQDEKEEGFVSGGRMKCWNCANHGVKSRTDNNGVCEVCGFDVKLVYNGSIEADRAAQRAERARQAFGA